MTKQEMYGLSVVSCEAPISANEISPTSMMIADQRRLRQLLSIFFRVTILRHAVLIRD